MLFTGLHKKGFLNVPKISQKHAVAFVSECYLFVYSSIYDYIFYMWLFLWESLFPNLWIRLKANEEWLAPNIEGDLSNRVTLLLKISCEKYVYVYIYSYLHHYKSEVRHYPTLLHTAKAAKKCCQWKIDRKN